MGFHRRFRASNQCSRVLDSFQGSSRVIWKVGVPGDFRRVLGTYKGFQGFSRAFQERSRSFQGRSRGIKKISMGFIALQEFPLVSGYSTSIPRDLRDLRRAKNFTKGSKRFHKSAREFHEVAGVFQEFSRRFQEISE